MAPATWGRKGTNDIGLEGFPCADADGGLNGCGAGVAFASGFCFCQAGYDEDGQNGDTADMSAMFDYCIGKFLCEKFTSHLLSLKTTHYTQKSIEK